MKPLLTSISKREWQFVVLLTVVMIIITGGPYLYGYLAAPPGQVYNGLHALSPGDIPVYYSYINQVKDGALTVKNLFTSEIQTSGTINVWWLLVGVTARVFNLSVIVVFQLFRLLLTPVFLVIAYLFISYFFSSAGQRKLALVFLLFSGGVGVYLAGAFDQIDLSGTASYWWPIDLWLTEALTFNALYQTSHFIASIALTLLIFLLLLLAFDQKKIRYALISGVLTLLYLNFHPYYLPIILGVPGLYLLYLTFRAKKILWPPVGYLALVTLFALPAVFYHFWLIVQNPVIGQRAVQNVTLISPLPFVLAGYGFLLVGFAIGLYYLVLERRLNQRFVFLLIWLVVNIALIYSPFPFHSRYTQGLQVIFVIFTVVGLTTLYQRLAQRLKPQTFNFWLRNPILLGLLFIMLFGLSVIYSVGRDLYYFKQKPGSISSILYLPADVMAAFDWLSQEPPGQVILAADVPSKFTPGFSGQSVYLAHAHETLFYASKLPELLWFFADNQDNEAKVRFLTRSRINYILYSDYEKQLGVFNPADKSYLELVFDRPQAQVYRVIQR